MREFAFDIFPTPPLGLRPNARALHRVEHFVEAQNVQGSPYGLEGYEPVTDPFTGSETVVWPNPQVHRGELITLLFGATSLKDVNEGVVPWTAAAVTTYDPDNPSSTKAITSGGQWHVADMGSFFYAFNDSCVVFRLNVEGTLGLPNKTFVQNSVTIRTGCSHRGRIIFGGFNSANFWNESWQKIFEQWKADVESTLEGLSTTDIAGNWVFWSSIGGGDFPLWLFYPFLYDTGHSAPTAERFIELLKRNELGWMQMPFQGDVVRTKPLGDNIIVYGKDGIAALIPSKVIGETPSTFGLRELTKFGVVQRDAIGGDENSHIFIDETGELWQITGDLNVQRLGYSEFLFPMIGESIRINYDPQDQQFWISSDNHSFLFNNFGLYKVYQRVTSGAFVNGAFVGLFSNQADVSALVTTSPLDMGHFGLKMITFIGVDVRASADVLVAIDYRYTRNVAWARGKWVILNKEGNARVNVSGLEFRIAVKCATSPGFEIDDGKVRWQRDDLRVVRGPDADPSVTRTSQ